MTDDDERKHDLLFDLLMATQPELGRQHWRECAMRAFGARFLRLCQLLPSCDRVGPPVVASLLAAPGCT
jgi:hypothetical protein